MKTFATLLIAAAIVAIWVVWVRPAIRNKPWAAGFFAAIEPYEIALWKKSETILWERFKHVLAIVLVVLPQIGAFDPTPFIGFVPDDQRWWVILIPSVALAMDGLVGEMLRNRVTKPVEVVAMPESAAKDEVVEKIEEAVTEGKVAAAVEAAKVPA